MRVGWYQRYQNYYAEAKNVGMTHEEARKYAINKLKNED